MRFQYTKKWFFISLSIFVFLPSIAVGDLPVSSSRSQASETFDFRPNDVIKELTPEIVKENPMAILFSSADQYDTEGEILALMDDNPIIFQYLPKKWKSNDEIMKMAIEKGLPEGVELTKDIIARIEPGEESPESLFPSYTPNGYLAAHRSVQKNQSGERFKVLETKIHKKQTWYKIVAENKSNRDADKRSFNELSNVGSIEFRDFSFSRDAGWIPATATKSCVLTSDYYSDIYVFQDVQNGDMGLYANFDSIHFEGFGALNYLLWELMKKGTIRTGDKIRVIWKAPNSSVDGSSSGAAIPTIEWLPFESSSPALLNSKP